MHALLVGYLHEWDSKHTPFFTTSILTCKHKNLQFQSFLSVLLFKHISTAHCCFIVWVSKKDISVWVCRQPSHRKANIHRLGCTQTRPVSNHLVQYGSYDSRPIFDLYRGWWYRVQYNYVEQNEGLHSPRTIDEGKIEASMVLDCMFTTSNRGSKQGNSRDVSHRSSLNFKTALFTSPMHDIAKEKHIDLDSTTQFMKEKHADVNIDPLQNSLVYRKTFKVSHFTKRSCLWCKCFCHWWS